MNINKTLSLFIIASLTVSPALAGGDDDKKPDSSSSSSSSSSEETTTTTRSSGFARYFGEEGRLRYEREQQLRDGSSETIFLGEMEKIDAKKFKELVAQLRSGEINGVQFVADFRKQGYWKLIAPFLVYSDCKEEGEIQTHEVVAWMIWLQHSAYENGNLRELLSGRWISKETFEEASRIYKQIPTDLHRRSHLEHLPAGFAAVRTAGQMRLVFELSFHGLTDVYEWATSEKLLVYIRLFMDDEIWTWPEAAEAFTEYFIRRGFDATQQYNNLINGHKGNLLQLVEHHKSIPLANMLLNRGESMNTPITSTRHLGNFMSLESQTRRGFRDHVGRRLPPAIAALVLNYAGYMEASVDYVDGQNNGSERLVVGRYNEARSWLHRGVVAMVSWLFSCPTKLICRGKRSKTL
jgi:hypothetical protein